MLQSATCSLGRDAMRAASTLSSTTRPLQDTGGRASSPAPTHDAPAERERQCRPRNASREVTAAATRAGHAVAPDLAPHWIPVGEDGRVPQVLHDAVSHEDR